MRRSLNLMSERARKREQLRRCLRLWSRLLAGVGLLLGIWGFSKWRVCYQEVARQDSVESEYEPIRQLRFESSRLTKQIDTLTSSERIPLALANQQPLLSLIGLATQAVAKHDGRVYLRQIAIEREPLPQESARQPALRFDLQGFAFDNNAVTQLADVLREVGPFAAVELTTNKPSGAVAEAQQVFSIQCTN